MASTFPTALDVLTNPGSTQNLNSPSHSAQHANANDAIERLEAKVGITSQSGVSRGILFASSTGGFRNEAALAWSTAGLAVRKNASAGIRLFQITNAANSVEYIGFSHDSTNGHLHVGSGSLGINFGAGDLFTFAGAGQLQLPTTGINGGVVVSDVQWYRSAANVWRTPDKVLFDSEIEIDGALNHDGTQVGFFGVTPSTRPAAITAANESHSVSGANTVSQALTESALNSLGSKINSLITKLETLGILSTSA